jgi:hypothetical protein
MLFVSFLLVLLILADNTHSGMKSCLYCIWTGLVLDFISRDVFCIIAIETAGDNTVRPECRCALIKTRSSIERAVVSKNWIKQLHTLPVLHINRCLTTEYSETTAHFNGNLDTDNQIFVPQSKCIANFRTHCIKATSIIWDLGFRAGTDEDLDFVQMIWRIVVLLSSKRVYSCLMDFFTLKI